jgi:hypothetical protein
MQLEIKKWKNNEMSWEIHKKKKAREIQMIKSR